MFVSLGVLFDVKRRHLLKGLKGCFEKLTRIMYEGKKPFFD